MGCAAGLEERRTDDSKPMVVVGGGRTLLQAPSDKQSRTQDSMHIEAWKDTGSDAATVEPDSRRGSKQSQQSQQSRSSSVHSINSCSSRGSEVKERNKALEKERRDLLKTIKEHYALLRERGETEQKMPDGLNKAPTKVLKEHWEIILQNSPPEYVELCRQSTFAVECA